MLCKHLFIHAKTTAFIAVISSYLLSNDYVIDEAMCQ